MKPSLYNPTPGGALALHVPIRTDRRFTRRSLICTALLWIGAIQFGVAATYFTTTNAVWKYSKGVSEASSPDPTLWRQPWFDDAAWLNAPAPFYYTDTATEPPFYPGGPTTGTVLSDMINRYTCVFLRKSFFVTNVNSTEIITIHVAGDDGFIVWLNGIEVSRTNAPAGQVPYNGTALSSLPEPFPIHVLVLSNGPSWLREGTNVLAIQAMNSVSNSHDFGIMAGLSVEQDLTAPYVAFVDPSPGSITLDLTTIRVVFNEPVTNVEAADLLMNGQPAGGLTNYSATEYRFSFPPPHTGDVAISWSGTHGIRDRNGNSFAAVAWTYHLNTNTTGAAIISEFMSENGNLLLDEDGQSSDWVEIFNPDPVTINLDGWSLTDDASALTKWRFPATHIAANSYLVVFASGKDRRTPGAQLHTNFKLNQSTGYLALVRSDGVTVASEFAPTYPPQRENVSFGVNASGRWNYFQTPTPGTANGAGVVGFVEDTAFNLDRGFFYSPTNVIIGSPTPGATLVYTLNGTEPSPTNGTQVLAPSASTPPTVSLVISNTTLLRACAIKSDHLSTDVDTHTYIFPVRVAVQTRPGWLPSTWPGNFPADFEIDSRVVNGALPGYSFTNGLLSIPSLSLITSSNDLFGSSVGIYANPTSSGAAWEKRAAAELIFPDGRPGFHINCGIRIRGSSSADKNMTPKHSFSLLFRSEFGPDKLSFRLFTNSTVTRFDQLALRGCSTDSWTVFNDPVTSGDPYPRWSQAQASYMRDQWMRDAALAMGSPSSHGMYVHLYLNGLYWGLYNLCERPDNSFAASHLGGDKADYDSVADGGELHAGDLTAWNSLMQSAQAGLATDADFQRVLGNNADGTRNTNFPILVHLTNLVDTMILHIHAGAVDWAHHNWWAARRRGSRSEGFRFFVWDQEISNNSLTRQRVDSVYNGNPFFAEVSAPNSPAFVYAAMRQNAEFRKFFADRVHKHLFNDGVLTSAANVARWNTRSAEIDRALVGESARWADYRRPSLAYKREVEWASNISWIVNSYFPSNATIALERFRNAGLYPRLGAPTFSQFGGTVPAGYQLTISHTNTAGTIQYTVDGSDPRLPGGAVAAGALVYAQAISLISPTLVRARVRSGADWSALVEARFTTPQDFNNLLISELHYNPPMFGSVDGEEFEFLELQNIGATPLDLGGLTFVNGISFTFSNETLIDPADFFVLVRNPAQFAARFPGTSWDGVFSGKLDNGGELLSLSGPTGAMVLSFTYDDVPPWPPQADGSGFSLQRANTGPNPNAPNNWTTAVPTPGAALPGEFVDNDGDGMTDVWEIAHGFDPLAARDADEDADEDGSTNLAEFRAGTDPTNEADYLRFRGVHLLGYQDKVAVVLRFEAMENRSYSIICRSNLDHGCWTNIANFAAHATSREVVFTNFIAPGSAAAFFRIITPPHSQPCIE